MSIFELPMIQLRIWTDADYEKGKNLLLEHLKKIVAVGQIQPLSIDWMYRGTSAPIVDHFGFMDGTADPHIDPRKGGVLYPNVVQLGEVLLGYSNAADEASNRIWPANGARNKEVLEKFLKNGSFLVIRKLRQDRQVLEDIVEQAIATNRGLKRELLLAKMVGRWPEGSTDDSKNSIVGIALATNKFGTDTNDFNFNGDEDKLGMACPYLAHMRRANPRSQLEAERPLGARPPRIFRRGMSYGPTITLDSSKIPTQDSFKQNRGLMFMCYNASIGEQFEVVQRWLAGGNSSGAYSGQSDPLVGVPEPGRRRFFRRAA